MMLPVSSVEDLHSTVELHPQKVALGQLTAHLLIAGICFPISSKHIILWRRGFEPLTTAFHKDFNCPLTFCVAAEEVLYDCCMCFKLLGWGSNPRLFD